MLKGSINTNFDLRAKFLIPDFEIQILFKLQRSNASHFKAHVK